MATKVKTYDIIQIPGAGTMSVSRALEESHVVPVAIEQPGGAMKYFIVPSREQGEDKLQAWETSKMLYSLHAGPTLPIKTPTRSRTGPEVGSQSR